MDTTNAGSVRAVLRVRPPLGDEAGAEQIIMIDGRSATIPNPRQLNQSLVYTFDNCYGSEAGQEEIFDQNIVSMLERVLQGYNSTVFAYGHTGAGKTHTMQGGHDGDGMIQRSIKHILNLLEAKQAQYQTRWSLKLSYLEIYKEKVYDLLAGGATLGAVDLQLREDTQRHILIPGLTELEFRRMDEFNEAWEAGQRNRRMAATKLNSQSSRSHACLILSLEQKPPIGPGLKSKLHLIDLAGSEDNRRTANTGDRLAESGAINSSLFVLGQVVDALNKGAPRIPYRDSKLTRLLQDSLGGTAYSLLITNVAPTVGWLSETTASLNFASKSRSITNRVVQNIIVEEPSPAPEVQKTSKTEVKKRARSYDDEEEWEEYYESEDEGSLYELSENDVASSQRQSVLPTPVSNSLVKSRSKDNPFFDKTNPIESAIEKQIEAKVAAKLREISKGTILSPLLKGTGEIDLAKLKKTIKKGSSLRHAVNGENADPNIAAAEKKPKQKSKKQSLEDSKALEELTGILNMFPTVEPDLLHILNNGTAKQLTKLKEFGATRAEQVISARRDQFTKIEEMEERGVFGAKVLLKLVYANAMDADGLASLAHNVGNSGVDPINQNDK